MDRPFLLALVLAFLVILLALMLFGWRRRQRSQAGLPRPLGLPDDPGEELLTAHALYVATTIAEQPLNRIAVAGLGYRARATVGVTAGGLTLSIPGQSTIFIPASDIRAVEKATWTIDRVVEQDGLVLVRWALGGAEAVTVDVDSYFRLGDAAEAGQFFTSVQTLHANNSRTGGRDQ